MFDVAITSYKRPAMVKAAVMSCLNQGPLLHKVIVVDDASRDETAEVVRSLSDPRIVFYQRAENGGIGAARRDAFNLSEADWTLTLDSDHELLPGAVRKFAVKGESLSPDIGILGARYVWDDGHVTPLHLPPGPIDYHGRIEWATKNDSIGSDYVCCIARWVRDRVQWQAWRGGTIDTLFHLDIAAISKAVFLEEAVALQKACAQAGHSRGSAKQRFERRTLDAPDALVTCETILRRHGEALRRYGPASYSYILQRACFFALLSGRRRQALRYWQKARSSGYFPRNQAVGLLIGWLLGRKAFKALYHLRESRNWIKR